MAIGTLTYKMTLRPLMKPVLIVSALLNWNWMIDACFKKQVVREGQEVDLNG